MKSYTEICSNLRKQAAEETSTSWGDIGRALPGSLVTGLAPQATAAAMQDPAAGAAVASATNLGALLATAAGYGAQAPSVGEMKSWGSGGRAAVGMLPFAGTVRLAKRRTGVAKALGADKSKAIQELFGPSTSILGTAGLGAGIGGIYGAATDGDAMDSAVGGAIIGAGAGAAAGVVGLIAAAIARRRTLAQQQAYQNGGSGTVAANLLVPGMAAYNNMKSLGASNSLTDPKSAYPQDKKLLAKAK